MKYEHDVIIVGAGIAGSSLAHALGKSGRNVLLIERDLREPDRIVGELLQPAGLQRLVELGLEGCLTGIDATDVYGYGIVIYDKETGEQRQKLPYPKHRNMEIQGSSFHHGRFVQKLREAAKSIDKVTMVQGTVLKLLEDQTGVIGVSYKTQETKEAYAPLTVVCDGCFSNLRNSLGAGKPFGSSNFVGVIVEDCELPFPKHGHVFLAHPGPILGYQIGSNEIRVLVDIPSPLPSSENGELAKYLEEVTLPQLPEEMREPFRKQVRAGRIRSMPNRSLYPNPNTIGNGVVMIGDAWNMRHPLTGGGMSVALNDVVLVRNVLAQITNLENKEEVKSALKIGYICERKAFSSTINVLANALYGVFAASADPLLPIMRKACLDYFKLGGSALEGPMSLLAGVCGQPRVLVYHFFNVGLYGVWRLVLQLRLRQAYQLLGAASWLIIPLLKGEDLYRLFTFVLCILFPFHKNKE